MPVDLTLAGSPRPYPKRRLNLVSWIVIWALCCSIGACIALLLWPAGQPAHGVRFWLCVVAAPNAAFLSVLGFARIAYETVYLRVLYHNQHRQNWLRERVAFAQEPLFVLAQAYLFPVDDGALATTIASGKTVMAAQSPRRTTGRVLHSRLPDFETNTEMDSGEEEGSSRESGDAVTDHQVPTEQAKPDGFNHVITNVLVPLADTLRTLSLLGPTYTPAVRLAVVDESTAPARLEHVRCTLSDLKLPLTECEVADADEGLMLIDQWLDAGDVRPLLVLAAEWYEGAPPSGTTEGGVAVLFAKRELLGSVVAIGTLHRPVKVDLDSQLRVTEQLSTSALWGRTSAPEIGRAWMSGFDPDDDKKLAAIFKNASFKGLAESAELRIPDRVIGHAGSAAAWLAVAAAVESREEGPQLILSQSRTVQSAVLYTNAPLKHENRAETEEQH